MRGIARLVRLPLRLLPKNAVLPILSGPAHGMLWVAGSSDHGCWVGTYERETVGAFVSFVRRGDVVYDVGANVGYFTLAACAAGASLVVAVEPFAENVTRLRDHVRLNRLQSRVEIIEAAAADEDGWARWSGSGSQGHLAAEGQDRVRTVRLDQQGLQAPDVVKIDVEGAAGMVLDGMQNHFARHRPVVLVDLHSAAEADAVQGFLAAFGYAVAGTAGDAAIFRMP